MNTRRYEGIVAGASLLLYVFALLSEAAYEPGGIGFNEELTWSRMIDADRATRLRHIMGLDVIPLGIVAIAGMIAAIAFAFINGRRIPTSAVAVYAGILLVSGGWMGLLALAFVPFDTMDGEFLAEGLARITACGPWTALVLACLGHRLFARKRITEPSAGPYGSPVAGSPSGQP